MDDQMQHLQGRMADIEREMSSLRVHHANINVHYTEALGSLKALTYRSLSAAKSAAAAADGSH